MYIDLTWIWLVITLIAVWFWIRKESDKAYEDGVRYAIYMHSQGKCKYEIYENEDGEDVISITFEDG